MTRQYEPITVDVWRRPSVESRRQPLAGVVDDRGVEVARYGDPGLATYWRSSAKPFQARPWVDGGTIDHFGWGDEETAIMCALHVGAPLHVELVRRPVSLALGVTELSMAAARIPLAKQAVRAADLAAARRLAEEALAVESAAEVRGLGPR